MEWVIKISLKSEPSWSKNWKEFKISLPHQKKPFSKRNWGNKLHSLCSYAGKLKPSIAYNLVKIFVPEKGNLLDPFSGVGTIPLEGALQGKKSYAFDLSPLAYIITKAKLEKPSHNECMKVIENLKKYILNEKPSKEELEEAERFGFNSKIVDYYHKKTLNEILLSRRFFNFKLSVEELDTSEAFVMGCLLHILHGNRPYALSRRSHPLTPYAPTGIFEYKPLISKLNDKVNNSLDIPLPKEFQEGNVFKIDSTTWWPTEINNLDAIITSPPFFDSTRFYMANWIRMWFCGWSPKDFEIKSHEFIDERQKENFSVYEPVIRQSRERLKENGVLVFHLGKSDKCDMAKEILKISKPWFENHDILDESVTHLEKHGMRDKGRVTSHLYLILY